jgi:hypothetical protein
VSTVEQTYAEYEIPFSDTSDSFRAGGIAEHHRVSDTETVAVAQETVKSRDRRECRAAAAQARIAQEVRGVAATPPPTGCTNANGTDGCCNQGGNCV